MSQYDMRELVINQICGLIENIKPGQSMRWDSTRSYLAELTGIDVSTKEGRKMAAKFDFSRARSVLEGIDNEGLLDFFTHVIRNQNKCM